MDILLILIIVFIVSFMVSFGIRWLKNNAPGKPYDPREDGTAEDSMDDVWEISDDEKKS